jgi:SM-20-related protein
MTTTDLFAGFDLFLVRDYFDAPTCEEIVAEMRVAESTSATVYGQSASGSVDERVRKVARLEPARETVEFVRRRLWESKREVEEHFRVSLDECEEPQFLRYRAGDFFVAHQDGNTGMLRLDQEARRVSVVIFLSRQSETPQPDTYCGGSLVFTDLRAATGSRKFTLAGEPGTLVAFRSETTHEVVPVTHGERLSIACWYR